MNRVYRVKIYSTLTNTSINTKYLKYLSSLYVCMVNTIYLFSFAEALCKFIIAIINLRGVSIKLNKYAKIFDFNYDGEV